jgi:AbrB family looped-hinge helix DNA binding protein
MAVKLQVSRLQERGQVTIPREIRDKLGLEPGDMIAFVETEHGIMISPQEMVAMDALDKMGALLREKGITLEELIESGREIRGELIEKEYGLNEEQWNKGQ